MLGIAASSSITNETGPRSQSGAYSARNSAQPAPMGVATMSAMSDVTTVPYAEAAAPNCSVTGFQLLSVRKPRPKRWSAGRASTSKSTTIPTSTSGTAAASALTAPSKTRSPRSALPLAREVLASRENRVAINCDLSDELLAARGDRVGHRRVRQVLVEALRLVGRPPQQARERQRLGLVGLILVGQQPRGRGDGVRRLTGRIDDAEAQIGRDRVGAGRRRGGDTVQGGIDERAGPVLDHAVAQIVLQGVDQLDVADRVRVLLDLARDARVAGAAQAHRPVHRRAPANLLLPLRVDRAQIVGEAERGAGAVRAVHHHNILVDVRQPRVIRHQPGIAP